MRRLTSDKDVEELAARIRTLRPDSRALWGQMSCSQMVCHLADGFRGPLGERPPSASRVRWLSRTVIKWVAFRTPIPWAKGVPTAPEIDQGAGRGTPPGQFAEDVGTLLGLIKRFISQKSSERRPHSMFGPLTAREWARQGWAHVDHHLRQFGA